MKEIRTLHIKNMVCPRCIMAVRQCLEGLGLHPLSVELGTAVLPEPPEPEAVRPERGMGELLAALDSRFAAPLPGESARYAAAEAVRQILLLLLLDEQGYASRCLARQGLELDMVRQPLPPEPGQGRPSAPSREVFADAGRSRESGVAEDPLAEYAEDLTEKARQGKIDPLVGREAELDRALEVLCRRRKNNPLFVGDAGVGKTAMAEGLALRVAEGRVPEMFRDLHIFALDMGQVLAGTRYRGDFESRLKAIIGALRARENAMLFIDEIHTLVGAGATSDGSLDASNLLKPALASGELRCMGSTTHEELRNCLEKDKGLARRFQRIDIHEPSARQCLDILRGLRDRYAAHHGVEYPQSALQATVDLSTRYLRDRMLPDKAIDVMDEAGALVRMRPGFKPGQKVSVRDVETVVARMAGIPVDTVGRLLDVVKPFIKPSQEKKELAQVFQALRIAVNDELGVLRSMLEQALQVLRPGGRLVVITYHSLEDRMVKNFIRSGNVDGKVEKDFYGRIDTPFKAVNNKVIQPGEEEVARNPRSRSAKLRIAEKI